MKHNSYLLWITGVILILVSACGSSPTTVPTPTSDLAGTSIVGTAQAAVLQTLTQQALLNPSETPTLASTFTPILTDTPFATATPSVPMISVIMETLCRLGPDKVYDRVGVLGVGIPVQVYALDPSRQYYFIQNPSHAGSYCWVWGFYATPMSSFIGVPVYTPMFTPTPAVSPTPTLTRTPTGTLTPTPNFSITNPVIRTCSSSNYIDVTITNTGGVVFQSGAISIQDHTNGLTVGEVVNNFFNNMVGCDVHYSQSDLAPTEVGNLSSAALPFGVSGHNLTLNVKLCPQDNLAGTCSVKSITFKP